jgi:hypothetical protein
MTKITAGEYTYKSFTIRKVEHMACGASPASTIWNIYEDAEDMTAIESRDTKKDCKNCIDSIRKIK